MKKLRWVIPLFLVGLIYGQSLFHSPAHAGCTSEETTALVLDYMAGDDRWSWCWAAEEVKSSLEYWGIREDEGEMYLRQQMEITDAPRITIVTLEEEIPGKRVVFISTEGGDDPEGGCFVAEFYDSYEAMESSYLCYTDSAQQVPYVDDVEILWNYDYEPVMPPGGETDTTYLIMLTGTGIENHLNSDNPVERLADEAIVHGSWCKSLATKGKWGEATFVGYDTAISWDVSCNALRTFWQRLRCVEYPRYEADTEDAAQGIELDVEGTIKDNRLDCYRDCKNPMTWFSRSGVFGNTVWWETGYEEGSEEFTVRGYRSIDSEPEELAVVPARGGEGLSQRYWVEVPGGYERYDVVERDRWGRTTPSARLPRGERPSDWGEWVSEPTVEMDEEEAVRDWKPVVELVDGESVPIELRVSGVVPGTQDSPPSDALCADVVVYTSNQSLLWEAQAHLGREGLKYRSFLGSVHPEDARAVYSVVLQANVAYENACESYPGGCGRSYPVSPGPLLLIVGNGESVLHMRVEDNDGRCPGYDDCRSDFDITDVDGDGIPEGPVTRLPADDTWDVYFACHAAEEFNHGRYVDEGLHVVRIVGDCSEDDSSRCGGWPGEFADEVGASYELMGHQLHPTLLASEYLPYFPPDSKMAASRDQVNSGVIELWGVDTDATNQARWPGLFFWDHDYDVSQLTRKQRYIAWLPSCMTVSTWHCGSVPFVETFMFSNYPDGTIMAGAVGHLHGGWSRQHEDFAGILLEEREAASPGTPIARIAYDAVIRAQTEEPHLFDYARSVGVVGAYVTLPGFYCTGGVKACRVTSPGDGSVFTKGMTERIDWRMCLGEADGERIRKHSIFESRDNGITWSNVVDSVEASARRYLWYVWGTKSDECLVKVVTHVEEYDSAGGGWVPGYTSECMSGVFSIVGGGGVYIDPCPHLFVWREGEYELVNSVLKRDVGGRELVDDYVVLEDISPDDAGLVRFRIDEIEPDTAYIYGVGLEVLPGVGEVVVTGDGDVVKIVEVEPPISAVKDGKDVLGELSADDDSYVLGTSGSTATVALPGLNATEATLVVCYAKKDLPELPFGGEGASLTGLELRIVGSEWFLSGGDTTRSVILHPRQYMSETAVTLSGLAGAGEPLVVDVIWHSEHHLDALSISPLVDVSEDHDAVMEPVRVDYVPKEGGVGDGEWPLRLVPGDRVYLDFKPGEVSYPEGTAYLLSLEGYFVGPAGWSGIGNEGPVSLKLASSNPCIGPVLRGQLAVPSRGYVSLEVYDVQGRLVRRILGGHMEGGVHRFEWDLLTESKDAAASGLYFLRLDTPSRTITTKVVVKK